MVTKGTYTELQKSGLDFTSLLKKEVDEERQQPPTGGLQRSPSKKSSRSQSFSTQLPVSIFLWIVYVTLYS